MHTVDVVSGAVPAGKCGRAEKWIGADTQNIPQCASQTGAAHAQQV